MSSVMQLTWKKDKQMSHNAFSGRDNCESCFFVLSVEAKALTKCRLLVLRLNWRKVINRLPGLF